MIGGVSAASEATLSSYQLRFAIYAGRFSTFDRALVQCPRSKVIVFAALAKFALKTAGKEKVGSGWLHG